MVLYFLLDLPGPRPNDALDDLLPRFRGAWRAFDLVQVRAKEAPAGRYVDVLERVREAVGGGAPRMRRGRSGLERAGSDLEHGSERGRPLVLANDRLDAALAARVDGVHVGAEDLSPEAARDAWPDLVVGLTCHTLDELRAAPGRGADYLGVGSFFPSSTKAGDLPDPRPGLRALPPGFPLPVYAIGGITLPRLWEALSEPHVRGVAVSSAIQTHPDPSAAAKIWRRELDRARAPTPEGSPNPEGSPTPGGSPPPLPGAAAPASRDDPALPGPSS